MANQRNQNVIDTVRNTAEEGFEAAKNLAGSEFESLKKQANASFKDLKNSDAYENVEHAAEQTLKYAKDNVWQTILVSFGIGFVLGVVMKGKD
ncbi:MAG: DUF883 domain-containing protein [Rhizobacter sp.]|nr:DUF883 domain-containing protein [Chlorobiales bacterium]